MILKDSLAHGDVVPRLKVDLEISHSDSKRVEVGLWYGTTLDLSALLLKQLYNYQHLM